MDKAFRQEAGERSPGDLLRAIAREAIGACDPGRAVARAVPSRAGRLVLCDRPIRATGRGRIVVLACGKAAAPMFAAFMDRLREGEVRRSVRALVVAPRGEDAAPGAQVRGARKAAAAPRLQVTWMAGEHPVPGRGSFRAGQTALRMFSSARPGDDIVALLSGGGSALMAAPLGPFLNAAEKTSIHQFLVVSGAPIGAINAVRKHLSAIKGGRLAVAGRRARTLTTLVVSDVDPDRSDEVASGPTLPDTSTLADLIEIVSRYGLAPFLPARVLEGLRAGRLPESPKPRDAVFRKSRAQVLLSNADLRHAAVRAGLMRNLAAEAMPTEITGTVETTVELVARAIEGAPTGIRLLVLGGEVRSVPGGQGTGGRAQELALRLALRMRGLSVRGWAFLACGSDGRDGNSPAAGAVIDATTLDRARALKLDPEKVLARADSWRLFHKLGDDLTTGPTGTNVRDLYLLLTGLPQPSDRAR